MDKKELENLSQLARIAIPEGEEEKLLKDLESILGFVDQLKEVDVEINPEGRLGAVYNVMRDDGESHEKGIHTEAILAQAPSREGNYVTVKNIL